MEEEEKDGTEQKVRRKDVEGKSQERDREREREMREREDLGCMIEEFG